MSMELYVFSDKRLNSIAEWNRAMAAEGFEVVIADDRPLASFDGHQPARLRGREVWIEFNHWDATKFLAEETYIQADRPWAHLLAFRWSFDIYAGPAAYMAAAAYAKATDGIVYDCEEGEFAPWQKAADVGRELDREAPKIEALLNQARPSPK